MRKEPPIYLVFSASVGIFFGFYRARKAACLDPIEALRFEQARRPRADEPLLECRSRCKGGASHVCDPHAYVLEATRRAIAKPGAVTLPEDLS